MLYQMLYRTIGPSITGYSQFRQRRREDGLTKLTGTNTQAQTPADVETLAHGGLAGPAWFRKSGAALGSNAPAAISEKVVQAVPLRRCACYPGRRPDFSSRKSRRRMTTPGLWLFWQPISLTTTARSGSQRRQVIW
jgi:hypothetical protein